LHTSQKLRSRGCRANLVDARPEHHTLIGEIDAYRQHGDRLKDVPPRSDHDLPELLVDIGEGVAGAGSNIIGALSFLGEVVVAIGRILAWRGHFRAPAFVHQMELIVLRGVPIIVLISFAVGGIIAQQGIFQLRRFAAADLVVELMSILTLRELGVLLASIMVAGRSGSSFTAELGAMKMREEIDALRVMGFDPIDVLIIPRLLALVIGLPMLAVLADMASLLGGGIVAWLYQGINPLAFLDELRTSISMNTFLVGLIKAPFMALIIGLIASIDGLAVDGSTEELGRHVTASVVKSIFMVIIVDGLFAIFFAAIEY
jgi:phospholipid/cholesterol/gamma-HCH transport system permease protein